MKNTIYRKGKIIVTALLSLLAIIQAAVDKESTSPIAQRFLSLFESPFFLTMLSLMALFVIGTMIYDLHREGKRYEFKFGSPEFFDYFSKWYKKPGKLTIFCDNLNWTISEDNTNTSVLNALESKAHNHDLILFLSKNMTKPEILSKLSGAKFYGASPSIISQYSFSCLSVMGNNSSVIVRNKQNDTGDIIKFEELSNNYITELLNTIIKEGKAYEQKTI